MDFELLTEDVEYFSDIQALAEAMSLAEDYFAEKYGVVLDENALTRGWKNFWSSVNVKGLDNKGDVKYKGLSKYSLGGNSEKYKKILDSNGIPASKTPFDKDYVVDIKGKKTTIGDVVDERDKTKKAYKGAKVEYKGAKKVNDAMRSKHVDAEMTKQNLSGAKNIVKRIKTKHQLKKDYDEGRLTLNPSELSAQRDLEKSKDAKKDAKKAYTGAKEKVADLNWALDKDSKDLVKLAGVTRATEKAKDAKERMSKK